MKNIKFIFFILLFSCNNNKEKESNQSSLERTEDSLYPKIIDSLNAQSLYNVAKWNLYCIYCDDTVQFLQKTMDNEPITYASLDLRLESVHRKEDTTEMHFSFYKDSLKCDENTVRKDGKIFADGIIFKGDSVSAYTTRTTMRSFSETYPGSRFVNPLQPEVLTYIKNNQSRLHKWFRDEAKRRGIIQ